MATDWKDALAALGASGSIPQGEDAPELQASASRSDKKETVSIYIDRRKRRGKEATVIEGFRCDDGELKEIARSLKQSLGCGGSQRDGEILLQGDVRDKAAAELEKLGYRTKRCN